MDSRTSDSQVNVQLERMVRKGDALADSGREMVMDSKKALRILREAEWTAAKLKLNKETEGPWARFWRDFLRPFRALFH